MAGYVARRLAQMLLAILGILTLLFFLLRASGDPAVVLAGPSPTPDIIQATRVKYGLDRPLLEQYVNFMGRAATLDFGDSYAFHQPSLEVAATRLPKSLAVVLAALAVSLVLGSVVGVYAATHNGRWTAQLVMLIGFIGQAVPYFWLAILLVLVFAITLRLLPATGSATWQAAVLPAAALALPQIATVSRLLRGQVLDTLSQAYVGTARSKGVAPRPVLVRHVLPNALAPLISWAGIQFSFMLSALVVLEPIFNYQGFGTIVVQGIQTRDYPVVQAGVFLIGVLVIAANILTDIVNHVLDPRLRTRLAAA
jgi:peptide/nickel transport system permease protein